MLAAGFGLLILGYTLIYSGVSNITTGGQGWSFLQSLTGEQKFSQVSGGKLIGKIEPQGNSGQAPGISKPPASGSVSV